MALNKFDKQQLDLGVGEYFEPIPESPAANQIKIKDGWVKKEKSLIYVPEQTTVGFNNVASAGLFRYDVVYLELNGNYNVVQGNEVSSTMADSIKPIPEYCFPIAVVRIDEPATVIVTKSDIIDIRTNANFLYYSTYTQEYVIENGDSPSIAIDKIDTEKKYQNIFIGKTKGNVLPNYGSTPYSVVDNEDLRASIIKIDAELTRLKTFLAKTNLAETLPQYSYHNIVGEETPIVPAISALDKYVNDLKHDQLSDIDGSTYHVPEGQYNGLITLISKIVGSGNYEPDTGNPYITNDHLIDYVNAARVKLAMGIYVVNNPVELGSGSLNPVLDLNVDLTNGQADNGTFISYPDGGTFVPFTHKPFVCISPISSRYYGGSDAQIVWAPVEVFDSPNIGFSQEAPEDYDGVFAIDGWVWIAVGY